MTKVCAQIDAYPLSLAADDLDIAPSTLRVWARKLRKAKIKQFDHIPNEGIVTTQSMEVYRKFKNLTDLGYSQKRAIETIRIYGV